MCSLTSLAALLALASIGTANPSNQRYFLAARNAINSTSTITAEPGATPPVAPQPLPRVLTIEEATLTRYNLINPIGDPSMLYGYFKISGLRGNSSSAPVILTDAFLAENANVVEWASPISTYDSNSFKAEFYHPNATKADSDGRTYDQPVSLIFGIKGGATSTFLIDLQDDELWQKDSDKDIYRLTQRFGAATSNPTFKYHDDLYRRTAHLFFNKDHTAITNKAGAVLPQYHV